MVQQFQTLIHQILIISELLDKVMILQNEKKYSNRIDGSTTLLLFSTPLLLKDMLMLYYKKSRVKVNPGFPQGFVCHSHVMSMGNPL